MSDDPMRDLYEAARLHGLSHGEALEVVADGELRCWCGNPEPCVGGARRFIGCPLGPWSENPIPLNFTKRGAAA